MSHVIVRRFFTAIIPVGFALSAASAVAQVPTKLLIRVTARDAKIIGSGVGGAMVTVRHAETGNVLARGLQEGSTGSTDLIMQAQERGETVYDTEGAAGFVADLELSEPTTVVIEAEGPMGSEHAVQRAQKTITVVPGRDILGEGIIIELNGFLVELLGPMSESLAAGEPFEVRGRVRMMCGCPTEPGGMWDSNGYEILARAVRGAEVIGEWPMSFTGTTSEFSADVSLDAPGEVELQVLAIDAGRGNVGLARRTVTIR
jgi:hypothetical protein